MSRTWSLGVALVVTGGLVIAALVSLRSSSERTSPGSTEASSSRRSGAGPGAERAAPPAARRLAWVPRSSSPEPPVLTPDERALALATAADDGPMPSFEQEVERERDMIAADWQAFESEAHDPRWASETELELESRIATVQTQVEGLRGHAVECKSHRCMVTLDWDSRGNTERAMGALIHEVVVPSCGRTLYLTPTPGSMRNDEPYQQVISIHCPVDDA